MRRAAVVIGIFLVSCTGACTLRRHAEPLSPYCRGGPPLAGVYHPQRLVVKNRCRVAVGTVRAVKFEDYDGDVTSTSGSTRPMTASSTTATGGSAATSSSS